MTLKDVCLLSPFFLVYVLPLSVTIYIAIRKNGWEFLGFSRKDEEEE